MQGLIFAAAKSWRKNDSERFRMDREKLAIEKGMNVRTEKQAIVDLISFRTAIWMNVSSF